KSKTLTKEEHALRSKKVCDQAIQHIQNSNYKKIHLFLPIERNKEVDTKAIYLFLKESIKYDVILPKMDYVTNQMVHIQLTDKSELVKAKFGILEPDQGLITSPSQMDCIFVPLISFDRIGNRIGYGGGYYDRFLKNISSHAIKIGLAITPPLDLIPYSEVYDVQLDQCINHHGLYTF
ncbi:MAG: 5-formyltetrahydrofolate cyclo-ligase, partial [Roseivirga sp.]